MAGKDDVRIAVAFWGSGGAAILGLERVGAAKVLCNLRSGSCDPGEIRRLMEKGLKVRAHDRLHAKVYWTAGGAVVGSSNASTNGLAMPGNVVAGWCEANLLTHDPTIIHELGRWFEARWSEGQRVTERLLETAQAKWDRRSSERRFEGLAATNKSLLTAVAEEQRLFEKQPIYLYLHTSHSTTAAGAAVARARDGEPHAPAAEAGIRYDRPWWAYELDDGVELPADAWLIDCSKIRVTRVHGIARTGNPVHRLPVSDGESSWEAQIAFKERAIVLPGGASFRLSANDKHLIEKAFDQLYQEAEAIYPKPLHLARAAQVLGLLGPTTPSRVVRRRRA